MTFADSQVTYRDLAGAWGSFRLYVGGKDVTYFRGIPAQISSYQLTEPYSFGPAEFALPSLSMFEVDEWDTGSLPWMGNGKRVKLVQVDASGAYVRDVWRGFTTLCEVTNSGVLLHCDGEASGRLSLRTKLPDLFALKKSVGHKIWGAFREVNLTLTPYLADGIGVQTDGRGMSGSYLDYTDALLAATIDTDGSQYTVAYRETQGDYHLALKDTTTTDFTAMVGAAGVDIDLSDDLSERPTTVYGQGVAPSGLIWVNGKYPGVLSAPAPAYPISGGGSFGAGTTDASTITGSGISAMIVKLIGVGYLDHRDAPGGYDSDVTKAIKDLQDDAGLTQSGNMNTATWDKLYDVRTTGFSLLNSYVAPLAQSPRVRRWDHTANGSVSQKNPLFDPSAIEVDLAVDHGTSVEKSRARKWSQGVLYRAQQTKNWAGSVTLTSDVFAGDHDHSEVSPTPLSRLDIKPGMNVMLKHFDAGTKLHVSIVNVAADLSVTLGVDTQNRDAATLGEVIARNIESRSSASRQWRRSRRTDANARLLEFSEVGGWIFDTWDCPGGEWTVIPVFAGQAGSASRVRLQTSSDEAAYVLAFTAEKTTKEFWHSKIPAPLAGVGIDDVSVTNVGTGYTTAPTVSFTGGGGSGAAATVTVAGGKIASFDLSSNGSGYTAPPNISFSGGGGSGAKAVTSVTLDNPWTKPKLQRLIDHDRALLGAWGTADQPCGYSPGSYTNQRAQLSGDSITGLFLEDGGFDYHTFDQPVLYMAIHPDRDTTIQPQRVLWDVLEANT